MSVQASAWAMQQTVGNHAAKLVLMLMGDSADMANEYHGRLAYLAEAAELSAEGLADALHHLEQQRLVQPLSAKRDAYRLLM